ncbi:MAG: hypothetical protein C5B52_09120 [Bacteroidetes bacterium]|nr:MAG: hypothetical protein C5B52_09120 [Bacteroidota bacterium]
MKNNTITVLALFIAISSCHKKYDTPEPSITDASNVLLKDVNIERLPSPYFTFQYDNSGFVTHVDFASKMIGWRVQYENNRVIRMVDSNGDSLNYSYDKNQVISIRHTKAASGEKTWHYEFIYYNSELLKEIKYWSFANGSTDSVLSRKVDLQYSPDNNLTEYDDFNVDANGSLSLVARVKFTGYDNGKNVDDFYLLKNFFEDFLYLPQIKLQRNNPALQMYEGAVEDFTFEYKYSYNGDNIPVEKNANVSITRGPNTGQKFTSRSQYTYY